MFSINARTTLAATSSAPMMPSHSTTARNYDSSIERLKDYLVQIGEPMPTRSFLERWRDDMLREGLAVRTVNVRLAAARKLLRVVAADATDLQIKMVLNDWANVGDAKASTTKAVWSC